MISVVLKPATLSFLRALRNANFQQNNKRLHVADILRTFFETESVRLATLGTLSPDLSPTENVWSMVAERLASHHTPVTTVNELWHLVEAEWAVVPAYGIQSLYNSMPRRITSVIVARGGCSGYCFLKNCAFKL